MTTHLVIKDLVAIKELDSKAMAGVSGGMVHRGSSYRTIFGRSKPAQADLPTPHQHNLGDLTVILGGYDL